MLSRLSGHPSCYLSSISIFFQSSVFSVKLSSSDPRTILSSNSDQHATLSTTTTTTPNEVSLQHFDHNHRQDRYHLSASEFFRASV